MRLSSAMWSFAPRSAQIVEISRTTHSGLSAYSATAPPGLMMPAFSNAICSSVSPSTAVWSSEMEAMAAASGTPITFVASMRPPRPTSSTAKSQLCRANQSSAIAVMNSNSVTVSPAASSRSATDATRATSSITSSFEIISPLMRNRSRKSSTYGEVYSPVR